jgi:hypothetical protein
MQFVEVSVTGVRSAIITMRRPGASLRFVLFPMVHLGTPAFYKEVSSRLAECGVVVVEGVGGGSVIAGALAMAYRTPARRSRLGLIPQRIDLSALAAAGAEVINPDMTAEQFRAGLRSVPLLHRVAVLAVVPLFATAFRLFGSRRVLGRYLGTEDMPLVANPQLPLPALVKLILHDRDQLAVAALDSIVAQRADETLAVGVVYGAEHMIAVVRGLASHGYRPRSAEWLTIFDF